MEPTKINADAVCILLPVFGEIADDVFLEILKKLISRTKIDDYLCSAFISGLTAETLFLELEDVSISEKENTSKSHKMHISKMLGFWTANNFPSLSKKLMGEKWRPIDGRTVAAENDEMLTTNEFDARVVKKMKLRVIQLQVSVSTRERILKHFVTVPFDICDNHTVKLSKKMNQLNIKETLMEKCWQALKSGSFPTDMEVENEMDGAVSPVPTAVLTPNEMSAHVGVSVEKPGNVVVGIETGANPACTSRPKRARVDVGINVDSGCNDSVNGGNFGETLKKMGDDISHLTKWFDPNGELAASYTKVEYHKRAVLECEKALTESVRENESLCEKLRELEKTNQTIRTNLEESISKGRQLEIANQTLRGEICTLEAYSAEAKVNLAEYKRMNCELATDNEILREKFNEMKKSDLMLHTIMNETSSKKEKLEAENMMLRSENIKLVNANQSKLEEFSLVNNHNQVLQSKLAESDCAKVKLLEENLTLAEEIAGLKKRFDETVVALADQIRIIENAESSTNAVESAEKEASVKSVDIPAPPQSLDNIAENGEQALEFDDPVVRNLRPELLKLPFGWVKFNKTKTSKYSPAFVHPPDPDGKTRAQKLTADGYVCNVKNTFFGFKERLDDAERAKHRNELSSLRKLNANFKFSFE